MSHVTHIMLCVSGVLSYTCLMQQKVAPLTLRRFPVTIRANKKKLEFDSTRDASWGGYPFSCRTISAHGWRADLFGETLLTLQRFDVGSGDRELDFRSLLLDADLMCVEVGTRTAQEMGIADYMNVKLIPECGYLNTVIDIYGPYKRF